MSSSSFPRTLALLRKEKALSQKQVATDLGISQALLSHYEKGIRECGLAFIVKCADYFGVSADYLLGISPERKGTLLGIDDLPATEVKTLGNAGPRAMLPTLNKRLINNSLNILYDYLTKIASSELTTELSDYLMLAIYNSFRTLHSANKSNADVMFQIPCELSYGHSSATMNIIEVRNKAMLASKKIDNIRQIKDKSALEITTEGLSLAYPLYASSLFNLIKRSEEKIMTETSFSNKKKKAPPSYKKTSR